MTKVPKRYLVRVGCQCGGLVTAYDTRSHEECCSECGLTTGCVSAPWGAIKPVTLDPHDLTISMVVPTRWGLFHGSRNAKLTRLAQALLADVRCAMLNGDYVGLYAHFIRFVQQWEAMGAEASDTAVREAVHAFTTDLFGPIVAHVFWNRWFMDKDAVPEDV